MEGQVLQANVLNIGMKSFRSHLAEATTPSASYVYRWVPRKGYSAATLGNVYGYELEFGEIVPHPMTGQRMLADPFNPLKGQVLRPIGGSWKPIAPLKPEGKITQKVIDAAIEWQRKAYVNWKRDPVGRPDAHLILAHIMKVLTGK
jgi:hypothetical protein